MKRNLSAIKNMGWAAAILLCLLMLFIALVIAAFTRYSGPIERGGVLLGAEATEAPAESEELQLQTSTGELMQLGETEDAGQGYIDGLTFLCDSSMIGIRDYGLLSGGQGTVQVWGSSAGNIPASELAECTIRYPGDGSEISAVSAAMIAKPSRLIMVLGSDGVTNIDEDSFVQGYSDLIRGIREVSPYTVIVCCSVSSVTAGYTGADGLNPTTIKTVNDWIRRVCTETGCYFADTASSVDDKANWLMTDFASANGKALNSAGINQVLMYLRTHAVQG